MTNQLILNNIDGYECEIAIFENINPKFFTYSICVFRISSDEYSPMEKYGSSELALDAAKVQCRKLINEFSQLLALAG